ncbi:Uncharacterised protein [Streptococcus pneumoniae]|nr:Uncharacterised protein [Streptococcus pneumoniae]
MRELVALVLVRELVFLLLAVAVESSGYILLLIYEHSLLQLVDQLVFLVLVDQLASLVFLVEALVLVQELDSQALQLVFLAY